MNNKGIYVNNSQNIREVWVDREDNILEYKLWVIFEISFKKETEKKVLSFLEIEKNRYNASIQSTNELKNIAHLYTDLTTDSQLLPPRLIGIEKNELNKMKTELISIDKFIYGDSIGGISPNKPIQHNEKSLKDIQSAKTILINPGVLARIVVSNNENETYIFQLAEKNLRKKNQIFYKPIGGHLKYTSHFEPLIEKLNLNLKNRDETQDANDLSLYVEPDKFFELSNILKKELLSKQEKFFYIENPKKSIYRELEEEIGHIFASDGISLLNETDMKLVNI